MRVFFSPTGDAPLRHTVSQLRKDTKPLETLPLVFLTPAVLIHHPLIDIRADPCELHGAQIRYLVAAVIKYGVYLYARSSELH
jgi:hypothetical protein